MYVIAVNKSQEFSLNVRRLFKCFFFDDDAMDSTSTTSRCFFRRRRTLALPSVCSSHSNSRKRNGWTFYPGEILRTIALASKKLGAVWKESRRATLFAEVENISIILSQIYSGHRIPFLEWAEFCRRYDYDKNVIGTRCTM